MTAERPAGVTAVAMVFLVAAVYLLGVGLAMLVRPGSISMAAGAELLGGLELAGPYMFLLMAAVGAIIALGLWQRQDWARWIAILVALIGVVLLLPSVSSALFDFRLGKLAWGGLETIVRSLVVWYLYQPAVREAYTRK
jgi:hypothetical protein